MKTFFKKFHHDACLIGQMDNEVVFVSFEYHALLFAYYSRDRSVLAPDTMHTTVLPLISYLTCSRAATAIAPEGSEIMPKVYRSMMVSEILPSVTVANRSTVFLQISKGISPICGTELPSQYWLALTITRLSYTSDWYMGLEFSGSTQTIFV
jgi:hypothetical protein